MWKGIIGKVESRFERLDGRSFERKQDKARFKLLKLRNYETNWSITRWAQLVKRWNLEIAICQSRFNEYQQRKRKLSLDVIKRNKKAIRKE